MKKLISLILIVCMACMLIPAMADDSILGTWYLSEITGGGMSMSPAQLGMSMSMDFTEDGKVAVTTAYGDDPQTDMADWAQDGDTITLTVEGQTAMVVTYADGKLTVAQDDGAMTFTREEAAAAPTVNTIAAESEEAFFGTWELSSLDFMGIQIPVSALASMGMENISVVLTVEAGKATLSASYGENEPEVGEGATSLVDGQLVIKEGESEVTLALTDTGDLALVLPIDGQPFNVYLSPVAAAAEPAA